MEGIYIYALDLEASKEPFYQTTTILNTGNSKTCTLNDLKKYRTYEFFVIPFYKSVHGKPSNSRTMKTMEDGKAQALVRIHQFHYYSSCYSYYCLSRELNITIHAGIQFMFSLCSTQIFLFHYYFQFHQCRYQTWKHFS